MITNNELEETGWEFIEKCPFRGKPVWVKDKHQTDIGLEANTFEFDPWNSHVTYNGGEFSSVRRIVQKIEDLEKFYEVLKPNELNQVVYRID